MKNMNIKPQELAGKISRLWKVAGPKIQALEKTWKPSAGAPVFTVAGRYTAKGWTEWTQGFQFGMALLQYDATGEGAFLEIGRRQTVTRMAPHLTHTGVHDHGFNNVSTYGNLWRMMNEGRIPEDPWERDFYELALKVSGAVQARRWTELPDRRGYIYSFNGPHSLFADTIRSLRSLALSYRLGHLLQDENDRRVSLLERLVAHARTTAEFNVYFGKARDAYDRRGRVVHESIFNLNDGAYRCPSSQQGFSPFTTWTRGLAWIMTGFAEQLEFLATLPDRAFRGLGGRAAVTGLFLDTACATCDYYLDEATAADGIPYWDTGAPLLHRLGDWKNRPAEPANAWEPVDSSAGAIAAQGLMRLGRYLDEKKAPVSGRSGGDYMRAGLAVLGALLDKPYLSTKSDHQGLLLHSVYHRPRGWDYIPKGKKAPFGESSMWGDYHLMEAALLAQGILRGDRYYTFFNDPRSQA